MAIFDLQRRLPASSETLVELLIAGLIAIVERSSAATGSPARRRITARVCRTRPASSFGRPLRGPCRWPHGPHESRRSASSSSAKSTESRANSLRLLTWLGLIFGPRVETSAMDSVRFARRRWPVPSGTRAPRASALGFHQGQNAVAPEQERGQGPAKPWQPQCIGAHHREVGEQGHSQHPHEPETDNPHAARTIASNQGPLLTFVPRAGAPRLART